jgi:tripartite-type tricarboxylate transporter receptor subunit TctC
MKKIILGLLMSLMAVTGAMASESYKIIVPNPAGAATTDLIARRIADQYKKNTGKNLVVVNKPGGNQIIAVNEFKKEKLAVIMGAFSMHVYNYLQTDPLPYQDSDFQHLIFFGEQPGVYFVSSDSSIRSINDLLNKHPASSSPFIGSHATNTLLNVMSLKFNRDSRLEPVNYKNPNDMIVDVVGGRLPVGFTSLGGTNLIALEKEGKIRFIANSTKNDLRVNDKTVPSLSRQSGVAQFNGAATMSITPGTTPEHKQLTSDLLKIVNNPEFRSWLQTNWVVPVPHDPAQVTEFLSDIRKDHVSKSHWLR